LVDPAIANMIQNDTHESRMDVLKQLMAWPALLLVRLVALIRLQMSDRGRSADAADASHASDSVDASGWCLST
jgi:hypothetical protein